MHLFLLMCFYICAPCVRCLLVVSGCVAKNAMDLAKIMTFLSYLPFYVTCSFYLIFRVLSLGLGTRMWHWLCRHTKRHWNTLWVFCISYNGDHHVLLSVCFFLQLHEKWHALDAKLPLQANGSVWVTSELLLCSALLCISEHSESPLQHSQLREQDLFNTCDLVFITEMNLKVWNYMFVS